MFIQENIKMLENILKLLNQDKLSNEDKSYQVKPLVHQLLNKNKKLINNETNNPINILTKNLQEKEKENQELIEKINLIYKILDERNIQLNLEEEKNIDNNFNR